MPATPGGGVLFTPTWSSDRREAGYQRWQEAIRLVTAFD
jgi:hypothetical protein